MALMGCSDLRHGKAEVPMHSITQQCSAVFGKAEHHHHPSGDAAMGTKRFCWYNFSHFSEQNALGWCFHRAAAGKTRVGVSSICVACARSQPRVGEACAGQVLYRDSWSRAGVSMDWEVENLFIMEIPL